MKIIIKNDLAWLAPSASRRNKNKNKIFFFIIFLMSHYSEEKLNTKTTPPQSGSGTYTICISSNHMQVEQILDNILDMVWSYLNQSYVHKEERQEELVYS